MVEICVFPWHWMDNSRDAISERSLCLAQRTATKEHHFVSDLDNMEDKKKARRLIFRLVGSNLLHNLLLRCHLVHYLTVLLPQFLQVQTSTSTLGWHTFRDIHNTNNYLKMTLWQFFLCFWRIYLVMWNRTGNSYSTIFAYISVIPSSISCSLRKQFFPAYSDPRRDERLYRSNAEVGEANTESARWHFTVGHSQRPSSADQGWCSPNERRNKPVMLILVLVLVDLVFVLVLII